MIESVTDLVLEMANVIGLRYRTLTSMDVEARVQGVLTGINLVIPWLEAGGGQEIWTVTGKVLVALTSESEPNLGTLVHKANIYMLLVNKKFEETMFVGVNSRYGRYSKAYNEGICKGFLHGMHIYEAYNIMSVENKIKFTVRHLESIKEEIKALL